jgi:phosphohistidine swiveling domain-containing protein
MAFSNSLFSITGLSRSALSNPVVTIPSTGMGPFDPHDYGTLQLWLDASDTPTVTVINTNDVTGWADKSGFARDVSAITDYAKYSGISVDIATGEVNLATTGQAANFKFLSNGSSWTTVYVGALESIAGEMGLFNNANLASGDVAMQIAADTATGQLNKAIFNDSDSNTIAAPITTDTASLFSSACVVVVKHVAGGTIGVTTVTFVFQNGTQVSVDANNVFNDTYDAASGTEFQIGEKVTASTTGFIYLNELLVYSTAMTNSQIANITSALQLKWGI